MKEFQRRNKMSMQLLLQDKEKNFLRELKRAKLSEEQQAAKRLTGETPPAMDISENFEEEEDDNYVDEEVEQLADLNESSANLLP